MNQTANIIPRNTATRENGPIPLFEEGGADTPFSAGRMNQIVRALNALLNMEIVVGGSSGVEFSGNNAILQIARSAGITGDTPTGSGVQLFHVKSIHDDYLTCRTWDGTTEGDTDIYVAKCYNSRRSYTHQIVDGVDFTFTYASDNQRTSSDGTNSQIEVVYPRYTTYAAPSAGYHPPGTIFAFKSANKTGVQVSGVDVEWVEERRLWLRNTLRHEQPPDRRARKHLQGAERGVSANGARWRTACHNDSAAMGEQRPAYAGFRAIPDR